MALHDYCGEAHGEVVTRLAHVERNCEELEDRLGKHCTNGGTGHVQRGEFARLETQVADLRRGGALPHRRSARGLRRGAAPSARSCWS